MDDATRTFESALARLEEIVHVMENGTAPLDGSLALFEEGISLVKLCNSKLDTVEQRIKLLVKSSNGELEEQNFIKEEEK